jgi:hypothetical protein
VVVEVPELPIKPSPPVLLDTDRARARAIVHAWKPLNELSPAHAEIVAKAIAQGIAEGRRQGLEMAKAELKP